MIKKLAYLWLALVPISFVSYIGYTLWTTLPHDAVIRDGLRALGVVTFAAITVAALMVVTTED